MAELINGRTPEEIKRNLSYLVRCENCPQNHEYGCDYDKQTEECRTVIDALALIEHLEAQQPKWISAEEWLPEVELRYDRYGYSTDLLVYDGSRMISAYYCHTTKLWHEVRYEDNVVDATHWKLFEPPEVEHD